MKFPFNMTFLSLGLLVFFLLTGCSRVRPVDAAMEEGMLLLGNGPEPQALDPHVTSGTSELNLQLALFEGLVTPHPETLEPLPGVAESWTVSDDGRVYHFKLRSDARWSDGQPIRSGDFVAAWKRALDPVRGTPYASMLYVLDGAEEYNRNAGRDFSIVGAKPLREDLLEVTLGQPVPYFLSLLMHPVWSPIPAHLGIAGEADHVGSWTLLGNFIGNGPFVLTEWLQNQYIEVEANPMYWDAATVKLKRIRFYAMEEPGVEERAFQSGQLHVTDALPPVRVQAYLRDESVFLQVDPYLGTYYILPNSREGVLADSRVRTALALTIDRQAIAEKLLGAGQTAAGGFVPDNMPGYDAHIEQEQDSVLARELLAQAGFPGGKGFPRLEYLFNSSESHRKIAEALQGMWRDELGIDIQLTNQEWRTYLQRRASGDYQLARAVWIGDYPEPSSFLDLWRTGSANNWAGWSNADYDARMKAAHAEQDSSKRMELYREAEQVLINEQAIIPLYHYVTVYLKRPEVKGWSPNLLDWHPPKYLRFQVGG